MTQAEFETHDCTLGEESSCSCVNVEVEELETMESMMDDNSDEDENDHYEDLDDACINDYSRDE